MTRLAARDLAALGTFARDLDERAAGNVGSAAALDSLLSLVQADAVEWGITDDRKRQIVEIRHFPPLAILRSSDPILATVNDRFWKSRSACPLCGPSRLREPGAVALSDIGDASQAHPQHFSCAGIPVTHQLNLFMRPGDIMTRHVALSRASGLDFDERDRQLLELSGVFLIQQARILVAIRDARAVLAAFEAANSEQRTALVILGRNSCPTLVSAAAPRLLGAYFGWRPSHRRLPVPIERWLAEGDVFERIGLRQRGSLPPMRRSRSDGELLIRSVSVDDQIALVLTEQPSGADDARSKLTTREREILDLVAEGMSNHEIGERLGISAATIGKHLEHTFAKLEVRSRAAAVARATQRKP